ncbi:WD40 repeat domain-containing protein [Synechococcus sp. PCC 6312]|uniref:WD40 repeat domain-containing protein n=1 Tax=Synechococcus sp. (strain ATCC 27167 / PCC 6312) TaxID=195253 RepID=UPI00029EC72D|nr:hypothetical protein [Synechococcus sp. PCC 6312]AFY60187.1 WD40 repeat-containing protein [Synechococcus sp. PCC 6312]
MTNSVPKFQPVFTGELSDYVTGLAWSSRGLLAACSAAGEVGIADGEVLKLIKQADGYSLSQVLFSTDGQFLAAAGQTGDVFIWQLDSQATATLITTLHNPGVWIDHLAWHPTRAELAIGLKHYVQVWDVVAQAVITTLDFAASSILGLDWHPAGDYLAVGGYQGIRVWTAADWDEEPQHLELMSACVGLAWAGNGEFMAAANIDRTLSVWQWGDISPWEMRGFPGKVKQLVWSDLASSSGAPLLASSCAEGIVVWERDQDIGWASRILDLHQQAVITVVFQPNSLLLASAGSEGWLCLWDQAQEPIQILEGVKVGFSTLAWSRDGSLVAAGGQVGEVLVWQNVENISINN